ncbi:MAG: thiol:disulfide interchange protein DsbA/DsbL [Steroidobacteraceae bacterium]
MKKLLLLAAMSGLLAACGAKNSGTSTTPAVDGTAKPATPAPAAAPTNAELNAATQESAGGEESAGDASLERMTALPQNAQLPGGRWKAGTHYIPVVPAQNTSAEPGQVEVMEVMWLGCEHCADLEPTIDSWAKQKPAYVKFVQEPVMWDDVKRAHAKLVATLQVLGRGDLIPKAFDEIHVRKNILISRTLNPAETQALQTTFAKANGIPEADFKREYAGFAVSTRLQRAEEITRRYRVETVPVIFINGKYQTDVSMAGGKQQLMQLITDLAAFEKGR